MAVWKNGLESKGLKVNIEKTKVMILVRDLYALQTAGKYPFLVSREGVEKNSIFCSGCSFWVHKKFPGRPTEDPNFRFRSCFGNPQAIDRRPGVKVQCADGKIDLVDKCVYLGETVFA